VLVEREGEGVALPEQAVATAGQADAVEAHSAGTGHGSEFVVRLPIVVEQQPVAPLAAPPAAIAKRRILVVDDNRDAAASLSLLLELDGHAIVTVHDGLAAYAAAEAHRPEVALIDLGLPQMDGYELCRRIREQSWGPGMVLVALTGWGQDEDRSRTRAAGFDAHLVKPVDYAGLLELLGSVSVQ